MLTAGSDNPEDRRGDKAKRFLCKACHCVIYGISLDPDKQAGIGINANNFYLSDFIPESFKPVRHIWYVNRVVSFDDHLPKYKDAPTEQFGSGELFSKPE